MTHFIAVFAIALAGGLHLWLVPEHYGHAPAHGIFLAMAGIAEIAWALAFWRRPTGRLYRAGIALAGGLIVLWAITRLLPAPFSNAPEPTDIPGLINKGSELIGMVALVLLAWQGRLAGVSQPAGLRFASGVLTLAFASGLGLFGIGAVAAPLLPAALSHQVEHSHGELAFAADETPVKIVIQARDFSFSPDFIKVKEGQPVVLMVENYGRNTHHLHIKGLRAQGALWLQSSPLDHEAHHSADALAYWQLYHVCDLETGICQLPEAEGVDVHLHVYSLETVGIQFTPWGKGVYQFECPEPGHGEYGMWGFITVE